MKTLKRFLILPFLLSTQIASAKSFSSMASSNCQNDYLSLMSKKEINVTLAFGHVDYDWYHKNPDDKKEMLKVLAENPASILRISGWPYAIIRWGFL